MRRAWLAAAAATVLAACAARAAEGIDSDLYFYLTERAQRCFVEELPARTILLGDYKHPEAARKGVVVRVLGPGGNEVYSEAAEAVGRFAFHSTESGEHRVCVLSTARAAPGGKTWPADAGKTAKFHLRLEIHGEDAALLKDMAKRDQLSSLERELLDLDSQVDLILKDLEYSKTQETHFRAQSERINTRIMWWSLFQTLLVLLSSVWQLWHLRSFFIAKKLV
jgi:hypothetical protein